MSPLEAARPKALTVAIRVAEVLATSAVSAGEGGDFISTVVGQLAAVRAYEESLLEALRHADRMSNGKFASLVLELAGEIAVELKQMHVAHMKARGNA